MSTHHITSLCLEPWKPGDAREMMAELGDNRRIVYGPGTRPRILVLDEDDEVDLSRRQAEVVGVFALIAPDDSFVACGSDNALVIWSRHGVQGPRMTGHTGRILGIWEVKPGRLLTLATDKTLRVWDGNEGTELHRMDVQIERFEELLVGTNGEIVCLMEKSGTRILGLGGDSRVVLKRQKSPLIALRELPSGKWITESQKGLRLWSAEGELLQEFEKRFQLEDGYLELPSRSLLIAENSERLTLLDETGRHAIRIEPDATLGPMVRRFIADKARVEEWMKDRPTADEFPHHNSPISDSFIASEALKEMDLPETQLRRTRFIWDFFNRPDFKAIKTAKKEEVAAARALEAAAQKKAATQRDRESTARKFRTFFIVLLALSAVSMVAGLVLVGAGLLVVGILGVLTQHQRARSASNEVALLGQLQPEIGRFIEHVKAYRRRILSQVPLVRSLDVYSGREVSVAIKSIVEGSLEQLALKECGLLKEDIIFRGQESIRLQDWALIQNKRDDMAAQINQHNQESFWWTDDHFEFAVQYVQYIFLTRDKLDVFITYYDFVADRAIAKEAHAFYYKDITSISKRDVFRSNLLRVAQKDVARDFEATEIIMASGGGEIRLTVLNEQSIQALRRRPEDAVKRDKADLADLEAERKRFETDAKLGAAERAEELAAIDAQLAELRRALEGATQAPRFGGKADEAIENIRTQIRIHKRDGPATAVSG